MKALWSTIVGDTGNLAAVAVLVTIELGLARSGQVMAGSLLVPVLALAGVAWLARR